MYHAMEKEYKEAINAKGYIVLPGFDAVCKPINRSYSKVEKKGIQFYELNRKLAKTRREIALIRNYINNSGLSDQEKRVIWVVAKNESLLQYARENGIQPSNIYKIRDRALKKMSETKKLTKQ